MKHYGKIIGWGAYLPENIVTNHDMEQMTDTNHEWIVLRTGIHERCVEEKGVTSA